MTSHDDLQHRFDLQWFKNNKVLADRVLNFSVHLLWFKQNVICKIFRETAKRERAEFYVKDKDGKINATLRPLYIEDSRFVYCKGAWYNEKVWVVAERLKYYNFPKIWEKASKWFTYKYIKWCFKEKQGHIIAYLKDRYGNRFYLPSEAIPMMHIGRQELLKSNEKTVN